MPQDRLSVTALVTIGAGGLMMYASVTGKSVLSTLYAITSGVNPATVPGAYPVTGTSSAPAGSPAPGVPVGPVAGATQEQTYAFSLFASYGWGTDQQAPLVKLWTQESGWRWDAKNPNSGAYGIPQSLPGSKMASAGADWMTNPETQIRWGLQYISQRYSTPAGAWAHEQSNNWY